MRKAKHLKTKKMRSLIAASTGCLVTYSFQEKRSTEIKMYKTCAKQGQPAAVLNRLEWV